MIKRMLIGFGVIGAVVLAQQTPNECMVVCLNNGKTACDGAWGIKNQQGPGYIGCTDDSPVAWASCDQWCGAQ